MLFNDFINKFKKYEKIIKNNVCSSLNTPPKSNIQKSDTTIY